MKEIKVRVLLPEVVYRLVIWAVLFYRKLRYGEAFRLIPLTKGLVAIVSPEDYERVAEYKWHSARHGRSIYAQTGTGSKKAGKRKRHLIMMHRMIMGVEDDRLVDHANHNGLDNRRTNVRTATWAENCWNKRKPTGESSSRFKGVMWDKRRSTWQAMIGHNGRKIFIGYFDDETEAGKAYDAKAKQLYGEFAALNFPEEKNDPPAFWRGLARLGFVNRSRGAGGLGDWSFKICYGNFTG